MIRYCHKCEKDVELIENKDNNAQLCANCNAILIHSASKLPPGTIIGGFEIICELGRGGMGVVYRAKQLNLERFVALKVLPDDLSRDEEFVDNFFKEARAAASLNHANIVQVYDAGSTPEGICYFAMELIDGETLESRIMREGAIPAKEAIAIAVKIADALNHAWQSQKLTHGDIKPDNIILNSVGGAKLADLGLAKFHNDEHSTSGLMATPLYAPPEIINGEIDKISSQSDMYSFGVTLFQILTGDTPFKDGAPEIVLQQHIDEYPPLISDYNSQFSPVLVKIVEQLLEKEPTDRPFAWSDISKALRRIKEPEIEGKIFHTHQPVNVETKLLVNSDNVSVVKKINYKAIISIMVIFVIFLLITIMLLMSSSKQSEKKINSFSDYDSRLKLSQNEFLTLSKSQKSLTSRQFISKLEGLSLKYGDATPIEAIEILKRLKKREIAFKKILDGQKLSKKNFNYQLKKILKKIKIIKIKKTKDSMNNIISLSLEIEKLMKKSSLNKYLTIPEADRKVLNNSYLKLSSLIFTYNESQEMVKRKKSLKKEREKLKIAKQNSLAIKNKNKQNLLFKKVIDDYYVMLNRYLESNRTKLSSNIKKLELMHKKMPNDYLIRVAFIKNMLLPNSKKSKDLLMKHAVLIIDKPLPRGVLPFKYKKYSVSRIDKSGIKLKFNEGKVLLGYTLKWSEMSPKVMVLLVKKRLLSNLMKLSLSDSRVIMSYMLLKSGESDYSLIENLPHLKEKEKRVAKLIFEDLKIASEENIFISLYYKFNNNYKKGDYHSASKSLFKLITRSSDSLFRQRYKNELKGMVRKFKSIYPCFLGNELLEKCINSGENRTDLKKTLNLCMVAKARYGNVYTNADFGELTKLINKTLIQIVSSSDIKELNANRIPFYYWSKEKPGDAWAYYKLIQKTQKLSGNSKVLSSMKLAATLDNGDWSLAHDINQSGDSLDIIGLEKMKETSNWAGSFIFAKGMLESQFGNGIQRQTILNSLTNLPSINKNPIMAPMITALAMEYAMMIGQTFKVKDIGSKYKFNAVSLTETRVFLLYILSLLNDESTKVVFTKKVLNTFIKNMINFNKIKYLSENDFLLCFESMKLIEGKYSHKLIPRLNKIKCHFPDVISRILLASFAKYYVVQNKRLKLKDELDLLHFIKNNIKSNVVSSQSWKKFTLFKIALKNSNNDRMKEVQHSLSDYRVPTTSFYPYLIILKGAFNIMSKKITIKNSKRNLIHFLRASKVSSINHIKLLETFDSIAPHILVKEFYINNLVEEGNFAAILGLILNKKNPIIKAELMKLIKENINLFSWEERFLIKQIQ